MNEDKIELAEHEKGSVVAITIKAFIEKRLDAARRKNDDPEHGEKETALLRGQIRELNFLLKQFQPKTPPIM